MPKLPPRPVQPRRERDVTTEARSELARAGVLSWRNTVGFIRAGELSERPITYGLCVGSSDLIACVPVAMSCPACGVTLPPVGRFVGIEVKGPTARWTDEQRAWGTLVESHRGVYGLVYGPGDVGGILARARAW